MFFQLYKQSRRLTAWSSSRLENVYTLQPGYTITMPSTKRLRLDSNSHTENG